MRERAAPLRRRLASWLWDYLVILAWLFAVFLMLGLPTLLGWVELESIWSDPARADVAITMVTVVPFLAYLILTESRAAQATFGKGRENLTVRAKDGAAADVWRVVVRNVVKALPWQFGHMAATRFANAGDPSPLAMTFLALSVALVALIVGPVLAGRRGVHDVAAGTTVATDPGLPFGLSPHDDGRPDRLTQGGGAA